MVNDRDISIRFSRDGGVVGWPFCFLKTSGVVPCSKTFI